MGDNNRGPRYREVQEPPAWLDSDYLGEFLAAQPQPTTTQECFPLHWAKEAMEPQPEREHVIKGIVYPGDVGAIVGEGGKGKTIFTLGVGLHIAAGMGIAGLDVNQCIALLIDAESGPERLNRNIGAIMRGHYIPADVPFAYVSLADVNLRNTKDVEAVEALIRQTGAGFVMWDALIDFMPGVNENDAGEMQQGFRSLRGIAQRTGAAMWLIHHTNKAGGYRGSTAIKGAVDLMLMFDSERDQANPNTLLVNVTREKARDLADANIAAKISFEPNQIVITDAVPKPKAEALGKPQRYVLRYLEEHGDSDMTDIMMNADSCEPASAKKAVYNLVDMGRVERKDDGKRGTPAVYGLKVSTK